MRRYNSIEKTLSRSGKLSISRCTLSNTELVYAEFGYVERASLLHLMNDCLNRDDWDGFAKLFRDYVEAIDYYAD